MSKSTESLVKAVSSKKEKAKKPYHVRIEDWAKGTLAPFICKTFILGFAVWGIWDFTMRLNRVPEAVRGAFALAIVFGLLAGAAQKKRK